MFLFFVRHFNDIDHAAPVVWKLNRSRHPTAVYCMNPRYDLDQDYRIRFLREEGVPAAYLPGRLDGRCRVHDALGSLARRCAAYPDRGRSDAGGESPRAPHPRLAAAAARASSWISGFMRLRYYRLGWARRLLDGTGARVLCFDYVMPELYAVRPLIRAARERSIPVMALPHGVYLFTNDDTKAKATEERRLAKFNGFDYVVVPNRLRKELLVRAGVSEDKLIVLGSARYCPEWLEQNQRIAPRRIAAAECKPGRLKLVFMMSKPQANIDAARMAGTLAVLAEMTAAGVDVKIKPHTRTAGEKPADPRLADASPILSAELCAWADVVLIVGSSVVTEAMMRGKTVLYLKYLHANTTRFEELGACWTISDEQELRSALDTLRRGRPGRPYSDAGVARFLAETVFGESEDPDVLRRYEDFIVGRRTVDPEERNRTQ